jgi:hypothetical protein
MQKNLALYLFIPLTVNLLLIGLYFSGNEFSQHLVSPVIEGIPFRSWREFGLLEQIQNLFILGIIVAFIRAAFQKQIPLEKVLFATGAAVFLFLFLEEIDYGLHFYSYFTGNGSETSNYNWHNLKTLGKRQNGTYLKKISDLAMIIWFILFPLLNKKVSFPPVLKAVIPSLWFIPILLIAAGTSNLAHYLDSLEWDIIDGVQGSLFGNTSEFRETNTYYICLLYAIQLTQVTLFPASGTSKSVHEKDARPPAENPAVDSGE